MRLMGRKERWDRLFDLYDLDRNGHLSEEDIIVAYQKLLGAKGLAEDSPEGSAIIAGMRAAFAHDVMRSDLNGDGKVTLDEWHTHYGDLLVDAGGGVLLPSVELLQGARNGFALYDVDGDGSLSLTDYLMCATIFAPTANSDDLIAHWTALAQAHGTNGAMTFDEFLVLFLQVWGSTLDLPFFFPG